MKKKLLCMLFSLLFSMSVVAMDDSVYMNTSTIKRDVLKMNEACKERCSFSDDVFYACTSKCLEETSQRMEHYMIRRYTAMCQGRNFAGKFNFAPTAEEEVLELMDTSKAYDAWVDPNIRFCAQNYMSDLQKTLQKEEIKANDQLHRMQNEHPVRSAAITFNQKIRRR